MAEEENVEQQAPSRASKLIRSVVTLGIVILVPMILALLAVNFILLPMLAEEPADQDTPEESGLPADAVIVEFEEDRASLVAQSPDESAPLLMYQVAMAVDSTGTATLIENKKPLFRAMLSELHRNRTRSELNDRYIQDTILEQARQKANQLLRQLAPNAEHTVYKVMYTSYTILDL